MVRARGERIGVVVAVAFAEYLADEMLSSHSRPPHQARPACTGSEGVALSEKAVNFFRG